MAHACWVVLGQRITLAGLYGSSSWIDYTGDIFIGEPTGWLPAAPARSCAMTDLAEDFRKALYQHSSGSA